MLTTLGQKAFWKYRSHTYGGLILNKNIVAPLAQTIQGVYYKKWAIGAGVGIDWYAFRSIPVFFSVTRDLTKKSNGLFVTLNAGTNFPAVRKFVNIPDNKFYPGFYWSPSMGLKFRTNKKNNNALLISVGYSNKNLKEERPSSRFCPGGCPTTGPAETISYKLRRFDFKLGWQF